MRRRLTLQEPGMMVLAALMFACAVGVILYTQVLASSPLTLLADPTILDPRLNALFGYGIAGIILFSCFLGMPRCSEAQRRFIGTELSVGVAASSIVARMFRENAVVYLGGGLIGILAAGWALETIATPPPDLFGPSFQGPWRLDLAALSQGAYLISATLILATLLPARVALQSPTSARRPPRGGDIVFSIAMLLHALTLTLILFLVTVLVFHSVDRQTWMDHGLNDTLMVDLPKLPSDRAPALRKALQDDPLITAAVLYGEVTPARGDRDTVVICYEGPINRLGIQLTAGRFFPPDLSWSDPLTTLLNRNKLQERPKRWRDRIGAGVWYRGRPREIIGIVTGANPFHLPSDTSIMFLPLTQAPPTSLKLMVVHRGQETETRQRMIQLLGDVLIERHVDVTRRHQGRQHFRSMIFAFPVGLLLLAGLLGITARTAHHLHQNRFKLGLLRALGHPDRAALYTIVKPGWLSLLSGHVAGLTLGLYLVFNLREELARVWQFSIFIALLTLLLTAGTTAVLMLPQFKRALRPEPDAAMRHDPIV